MDRRSCRARERASARHVLIAVCVAGCAGAGRPGAPPSRTPPRDAVRAAACAARTLPPAHASDVGAMELADPGPIDAVTIRGLRRVPRALAESAIRAGPASSLDPDVVAADIRRLFALEAFSDVSASVEPAGGGERLVYRVTERPLVARVIGAPAGLGVRAGDVYDPALIKRRASDQVALAVTQGYPRARVRVGGARAADGRMVVCVRLDMGPQLLVDRVAFVGNHALSDDALRAALYTDDGAFDAPGKPYRAEAAWLDAARISALYYDRGFLDVRVRALPPVMRPERGALTPRYRIDEGRVYRIGRIAFRGHLLEPAATYRKLLGVAGGEIFNRTRFIAGMQRIRDLHLWLGDGHGQVEPATTMHPERGTVDVTLAIERAAP